MWRSLYNAHPGLFLVDTMMSTATPEVLATPDAALGQPKLAADDTQLFFLRANTSGDIWLMRFAD